MRLTILGRRSPFPLPGTACCSYLLEAGKEKILLDAGSGCISRLLKHVHWDELTAVVLSHLHGDHISDMLVLKYAIWLSRQMGRRSAPLPIYCPAEPEPERALLDYKNAMQVVPVKSGDSINIGDVHVTFDLTDHHLYCLSSAFEHGGRLFVYSGDGGPTAHLAGAARRADLFLCEATTIHANKGPEHFSGLELGRFAAENRIRRLVATHFSSLENVEEIMQEVRKNFPEATEAVEGATYEV